MRRMFERAITVEDVTRAIRDGEVIEDYPNDVPYPSRLILYIRPNGPLHVVLATDRTDSTCIVVTAYVPDPALWDNDFRRRRS
jgi:hypothetical protein